MLHSIYLFYEISTIFYNMSLKVDKLNLYKPISCYFLYSKGIILIKDRSAIKMKTHGNR